MYCLRLEDIKRGEGYRLVLIERELRTLVRDSAIDKG
jgi:hypothetical protein